MIFGSNCNQNFTNNRNLRFIEDEHFKLGCSIEYNSGIFEDSHRNLIFICYGRIDSKSSLNSLIGKYDNNQEYIWQAFLKWGKLAPNYLIGDWSFCAYNTKTKELFLARDQNGTGILFYKKDKNRFCFSTSLSSLVDDSKQMNKKFAIGVLGSWNYDNSKAETFYEGINRLPPGYTLCLKGWDFKIEKYWKPENVRLKYYSKIDDYSSELLEITKEAVNCRIPSSMSIASQLSGGLDSGTISCLTSELIGNETLRTFSHIPLYDQINSVNHLFGDESLHIKAVAESKKNIKSYLLKSEHISLVTGIERFVDSFNTVTQSAINTPWIIDIYEKCSQMGIEVLFSGQCGNIAMSYKGIQSLLPMPFGYEWLKKKVAMPYLANIFENRNFANNLSSTFLNSKVFPEIGLSPNSNFRKSSGNKIYFTSNQDEILYRLNRYHKNQTDLNHNPYNVKLLDPSSDIRIIEFVLSIPNNFFFNEKNENRQVIRQMMKGRLPEMVRNENRTGLQSSDIYNKTLADIIRIDDCINRFEKNATFRNFVEIKKLKNTIELLKKQQIINLPLLHNLSKTIMFGFFIEKNGF